jgi:D-serine deaminase-like pyridoxal phosphate-dependent protein
MNKINDNLYTFEGQQDIVSPQLVYYPAIIRENIRKMIDIAGGTARLWPHIKTHKMAEVVQMQIEAGIDRFKCATIAEAEMAAKAGAKTVGLGPRILRCETAPLAVLSAVMTLTGNLE